MKTHKDRVICLFLAISRDNMDEMPNTHTIQLKFLIGPYK